MPRFWKCHVSGNDAGVSALAVLFKIGFLPIEKE
jgi:hypothetical protein